MEHSPAEPADHKIPRRGLALTKTTHRAPRSRGWWARVRRRVPARARRPRSLCDRKRSTMLALSRPPGSGPWLSSTACRRGAAGCRRARSPSLSRCAWAVDDRNRYPARCRPPRGPRGGPVPQRTSTAAFDMRAPPDGATGTTPSCDGRANSSPSLLASILRPGRRPSGVPSSVPFRWSIRDGHQSPTAARPQMPSGEWVGTAEHFSHRPDRIDVYSGAQGGPPATQGPTSSGRPASGSRVGLALGDDSPSGDGSTTFLVLAARWGCRSPAAHHAGYAPVNAPVRGRTWIPRCRLTVRVEFAADRHRVNDRERSGRSGHRSRLRSSQLSAPTTARHDLVLVGAPLTASHVGSLARHGLCPRCGVVFGHPPRQPSAPWSQLRAIRSPPELRSGPPISQRHDHDDTTR